ncbi:sugar phosphate isomerase/epimerase family protein [Jeotgalibacillus aurantiacus]|uniref:sugar phosphate isomerase/epimerase family protein n=1 Tax=Jeotgalibacillus aurantiacus TaxID=2763266 RepID=UPI001D0B9918|nr:sugar phosphate isomerase/epimerase [Jeotgalibacillus aurantiacus]
MSKVAIQLWSVKEAMEENLEGTLKQLSKAGYEGVQLAGDYGLTSNRWNELFYENNLKPAGIHVPVENFQDPEKFKKWITFSKEIGNTKLIMPYLDEDWRTADKYEEAARLLNEASQAAEKEGIRVGYHHHDFEFAKLEDGRTGWEILEKHTTDHPVYFEIDVYWTEYSGVNTYDLLERLRGRIFSIHLKDLEKREGETRTAAVGKGSLPLQSYAGAVQLDWLVVEQEHFDGEPVDEVQPSAAVVKGWL